jgi:hypothetical protein
MLLDKKEKEKTEREPGLVGGFITITFLGYYDRKGGNTKRCFIYILYIYIYRYI